jgi:hypothetical protein
MMDGHCFISCPVAFPVALTGLKEELLGYGKGYLKAGLLVEVGEAEAEGVRIVF